MEKVGKVGNIKEIFIFYENDLPKIKIRINYNGDRKTLYHDKLDNTLPFDYLITRYKNSSICSNGYKWCGLLNHYGLLI